MHAILEYSYDEKETTHLNSRDALNAYKKAIAIHRDALVILDDLDCGHWNVDVIQSDDEKQAYYGSKARTFYRRFLSNFLNHGHFRSK